MGIEKVEAFTEILSQNWIVLEFVNNLEKSIDDSIAGDMDARIGHSFVQQALSGALSGCEMQGGDAPDQASVYFFRPRSINVSGAQAGFDMANGNLRIKCGKAGGHRGSSVAVHQQQVIASAFEYSRNPRMILLVMSVKSCPGFMMLMS